MAKVQLHMGGKYGQLTCAKALLRDKGAVGLDLCAPGSKGPAGSHSCMHMLDGASCRGFMRRCAAAEYGQVLRAQLSPAFRLFHAVHHEKITSAARRLKADQDFGSNSSPVHAHVQVRPAVPARSPASWWRCHHGGPEARLCACAPPQSLSIPNQGLATPSQALPGGSRCWVWSLGGSWGARGEGWGVLSGGCSAPAPGWQNPPTGSLPAVLEVRLEVPCEKTLFRDAVEGDVDLIC